MASSKADLTEVDKALLEDSNKLMESETSLGIMLLGKPGIGKSTLVNALVGSEVAEVSPTGSIETEGFTKALKKYDFPLNKATINIWDTPGLLDPTIDTQKILSDVKDQCKNIDLYLFCIDMSQTRFLPGNTVSEMIKEINKTVGSSIWKKTLIILVQANVVIIKNRQKLSTLKEEKLAFAHCLKQWSTLIRKELKEFWDEGLHIIPVGFYNTPKLFDDDDNYWLSIFWMESLKRVPSKESRISLVKVNMHRLKEKVDESNMANKQSHEQDILISSDTAIGAGIGATVGAIAAGVIVASLSVSNPVGWCIAAAVLLDSIVFGATTY